MKEQVLKYGLPLKSGTEVKSISKIGDIFEIVANISDEIKAKSVIIATGKNPRRLNVPGEKEFENREWFIAPLAMRLFSEARRL